MDLSGQIVTPDGVVAGVIGFHETITSIEPRAAAPDRFILPGFIDTHVHGGDGGDAMDGTEGIARMARFHLRHGTTTLLPTTITRPWPEVMAALHAIAAARREGVAGGALIHGAHLEGPFINPERLGAQPPFTRLATPELVSEALAPGIVRVVTLAPEMPGAEDAQALFQAAGVRVSLGHSAADFGCASHAIASSGGVCGTHLFNAMGGIAGRAPGLAGAILASDTAWAELILDLHHVHPGAFRLARAAIGDRLFLITDAIRATGLGDGASELGGQAVTIARGAARLADGTLAGSVLTMDAALRNAVGCGLAIDQAARLAGTNAARYLGLVDRGSLRPGARADLVVLDATLVVREVWLGGVRVV
jgi:N-acetylglucosamine-6-phosphate deacetylase